MCSFRKKKAIEPSLQARSVLAAFKSRIRLISKGLRRSYGRLNESVEPEVRKRALRPIFTTRHDVIFFADVKQRLEPMTLPTRHPNRAAK